MTKANQPADPNVNDPIEQALQARGLTAPRVTALSIDAAIASEHYFSAAEGVLGAGFLQSTQGLDPGPSPGDQTMQALTLLSFCVLVMRNGYTVVGKSACASAENFDAELGRSIARRDAISQCWPLLGYELKSRLAGP